MSAKRKLKGRVDIISLDESSVDVRISAALVVEFFDFFHFDADDCRWISSRRLL